MIKGMRILSTESQVFMHPEEIKKYKTINIAYEFTLEEPIVIKDVIRVEYRLAIVYSNPSMGYLRYRGEVDCTLEKEKELTNAQRSEIAHNIMLNILPLALLSSRSMGLPPAVPLPSPPIEKEYDDSKPNTKEELRGYG